MQVCLAGHAARALSVLPLSQQRTLERSEQAALRSAAAARARRSLEHHAGSTSSKSVCSNKMILVG